MKFDMKKFIDGKTIAHVIPKGECYENIEFVGILCKSHDEDADQDNYFTVDENGKTLHIFDKPKNLIPLFSIATDSKKEPDVKDVNENVSRVVRHVRFKDKHGNISNLGGGTFIIHILHNKNRVNVYPAFCADDENFDKFKGYAYALEREVNGDGFSVVYNEGSGQTLINQILCEFDPKFITTYDDVTSFFKDERLLPFMKHLHKRFYA